MSYRCMTNRNDIEQLFRDNYAAMHRLAFRLLNDNETARDIVHDIFTSLIDKGQTSVSPAYLMGSVRNRCLNRLRDMAVAERLKGMYALDLKEIESEDWPDEATVAKIRDIVDNALPEQCGKVVRMRFDDGMSYMEIMEVLGISRVTVYKHLRRAIDILRSKLENNG